MERVFKEITIQGVGHATKIKMEMFENGGEIVRNCMGRPMNPTGFYKNRFDANTKYDESFEGVTNINEAKKLLNEGWVKNVDMIKKTLDGAQRKNYSMKNSGLKSDLVGYVPIVPNAIMGLPNSMLNSNVKPKKNKVINLVYGLSYSAYVDTSDIINIGSKVMEHIIKLEAEGFRVRLTCLQNFTDDSIKESHVLVCKCKSEDQPLDAQRIMFPMFHPAMFRAIGFGWYETLPEAKYISGYGKPFYYIMKEEQVNDYIQQLFGRTAIYIDGMSAYKNDNPEKYISDKLMGMAI